MSEIDVSFERDIRPLFRSSDREEMESWFDLYSHEEVRANAGLIFERLEDGSMPCDAPWSADKVALFDRWMQLDMPE